MKKYEKPIFEYVEVVMARIMQTPGGSPAGNDLFNNPKPGSGDTPLAPRRRPF